MEYSPLVYVFEVAGDNPPYKISAESLDSLVALFLPSLASA